MYVHVGAMVFWVFAPWRSVWNMKVLSVAYTTVVFFKQIPNARVTYTKCSAFQATGPLQYVLIETPVRAKYPLGLWKYQLIMLISILNYCQSKWRLNLELVRPARVWLTCPFLSIWRLLCRFLLCDSAPRRCTCVIRLFISDRGSVTAVEGERDKLDCRCALSLRSPYPLPILPRACHSRGMDRSIHYWPINHTFKETRVLFNALGVN